MSKNMPEQTQPNYIRGPRVSKGGNLAHFAHFRAREFKMSKTMPKDPQSPETNIDGNLRDSRRLIINIQEAAGHSWSAMIDEDRLLQRLETLEAQLTTYAKNYPEDSIREEMRKLLEDKGQYETTAKDSLRLILQEKLEAITKISDLERALSTSEDELTHVRNVCETTQKELTDLLEKQAQQAETVRELTEAIKIAEEKLKEAEENFEQQKKEFENKLEEKTNEENKLLARIECLSADGDFTKEQLSAMKAKYENIKNIKNGDPIKDSSDADSIVENSEAKHVLEVTQSEIHSLKGRLQTAQEELRQAEANVSQLKHEAELAESAEANCLTSRNRLVDDLSETKAKRAASTALLEHLQEQVTIMEDRLRDYVVMTETPKIYDDINDDDDTHTLVRRKKDPCKEIEKDKYKVNEDDIVTEKDKSDSSENLDTTIEGDTTLTIITTNDSPTTKDINGTSQDDQEESEILETGRVTELRNDIQRIKEILSKTQEAAGAGEKEMNSLNEALAQASLQEITAAHEASNLRQQLAASEALMVEKARMVGAVQVQVARMEDSQKEVHQHIQSLTKRLEEEKLKALAATHEATSVKDKLKKTEELVNVSVQEAEGLKNRIESLEERLEMSGGAPTTPLILPFSNNNNSSPPIPNSAPTPPTSLLVPQETLVADDQSDSPPSSPDSPESPNSPNGPTQGLLASRNLKATDKDSINQLTKDSEQSEVENLRSSLKSLQSELNITKSEYLLLKEKGCSRNEEMVNRSFTGVDGVQEIIQRVSKGKSEKNEELESLEVELLNLRRERDQLRDKLSLVDEDYQILAMQNKTTIPTWVMVVMVMALALAPELLPSIL
ncbi:unnamed protein product, partial [Meganyctiphanes norvegica]